jgi:hypothetical protein
MKWRLGIDHSVRRRTVPQSSPRPRPYTTSVNLKTAAFFALLAMLLLTVLDAAVFVNDLTAFLRDAVAAMTLLAAAIHLLASLALALFFFVFYRAQA